MNTFRTLGLALTFSTIALSALHLSGCATQELNTKASVALPVKVKELRVEFARVDMTADAQGRRDPMSASRALMLEKLEHGVESRMTEAIRRAGINVSYSVYAPPSEGAGTQGSEYRVKVVPMLARQDCVATGGCALSLRVGLTLSQGFGGQAIWHTELQESSMKAAIITQARYDELAEQLAQATLKAVTAAQ